MTAPRAGDDAEPIRRHGSTKRRVLQSVVSTALVIAIFVFVLPQVADFSTVWAHMRDMTWLEMTTLGLIAVWNLATYGLVWVSCLPGLTFRQAVVATQAPTAVANTVPGGSYISIGLTYSMLHSWGFRRSIVTLALLITGILSNCAKLAIPVLALACLALQGDVTVGRLVAAVAGFGALTAAILVFVFALHTEQAAARLGNTSARFVSFFLRVAGRSEATGWDIAVKRFREKTIDLFRARWHWITLTTVVSHLSLYLVLLVALRHIGVSNDEVGWAEVMAVFAFTRLVTAIPLTPGGLGVVELALTTGLVTAGGVREEVVAAVLIYRVLTFLLPIPVGAMCYVYWRRNKSWRKVALPSTALA